MRTRTSATKKNASDDSEMPPLINFVIALPVVSDEKLDQLLARPGRPTNNPVTSPKAIRSLSASRNSLVLIDDDTDSESPVFLPKKPSPTMPPAKKIRLLSSSDEDEDYALSPSPVAENTSTTPINGSAASPPPYILRSATAPRSPFTPRYSLRNASIFPDGSKTDPQPAVRRYPTRASMPPFAMQKAASTLPTPVKNAPEYTLPKRPASVKPSIVVEQDSDIYESLSSSPKNDEIILELEPDLSFPDEEANPNAPETPKKMKSSDATNIRERNSSDSVEMASNNDSASSSAMSSLIIAKVDDNISSEFDDNDSNIPVSSPEESTLSKKYNICTSYCPKGIRNGWIFIFPHYRSNFAYIYEKNPNNPLEYICPTCKESKLWATRKIEPAVGALRRGSLRALFCHTDKCIQSYGSTVAKSRKNNEIALNLSIHEQSAQPMSKSKRSKSKSKPKLSIPAVSGSSNDAMLLDQTPASPIVTKKTTPELTSSQNPTPRSSRIHRSIVQQEAINSVTSVLMRPSELEINDACRLLNIKNCNISLAYDFWNRVNVPRFSSLMKPMSSTSPPEGGYALISKYFTGTTQAELTIAMAVGRYILTNYRNLGIIDRVAYDMLAIDRHGVPATLLNAAFSADVEDVHVTALSQLLSCRFAIYSSGFWKLVGNWSTQNAVTILMAKTGSLYQPIFEVINTSA